MNSESPPSRSDFKDLLNVLADYGVRYLVVGAFAVMKYAEPRFTKDLDIWIAIDPVNASAVHRALAKFGAPLADVAPDYFTEPGRFYQLGISPVRVDVLTSLAGGIDFETAWSDRVETTLFGAQSYVPSEEHLMTMKKAAGRPEDLLDLKRMLSSRRKRQQPKKHKGK